MALRKRTTKVSKAVDPECSVLRTAGLVDPHCPVHGFAVERTGGLEMIRKLESRIEMLEAQLQKKTTTKKDVVEARNAIFNRFREGGGAFSSKKKGEHNAGGEVACYTLGGKKRGTCWFANFKTTEENIVGKLSQLAAQFTNEKEDGCWNGYTEMLSALDEAAAAFSTLVSVILQGNKPKSGGICVGLPGTGSYFLGGRKLGTCNFPSSWTGKKWELIKNKILEFIQALKKEKEDGCFLTVYKKAIQDTFDKVIAKFITVWTNCKPDSCPGTNTAAPAPAQKGGGKAKTGGKAKAKRSAKQQAAIAIAIKSKKTKESVKPKAKAKPKVKAKKTVKPKAKAKAKKAKAKKTCY